MGGGCVQVSGLGTLAHKAEGPRRTQRQFSPVLGKRSLCSCSLGIDLTATSLERSLHGTLSSVITQPSERYFVGVLSGKEIETYLIDGLINQIVFFLPMHICI